MALERRIGPAVMASCALHLALIALVLLMMRATEGARRASSTAAARSLPVRLVWLNQPGPGGGGGGGGNRTPAPVRRAESRGRDARTVPAAQPPAVDSPPQPTVDRESIQRLNIPVAALASGVEALPGAIDAPAMLPTASQGPGRNGGAGTGAGLGDGPGRGDGLRDGRDGGTGGDVYQPGGDVTMPIEIRKGTPQYTTEAMRARAQGAITVECVVQTTGVCTNIRVRRSFNPTFGLDQAAIDAAAQWRFRPGMRRGQAVPVLVTMEIAFALR